MEYKKTNKNKWTNEIKQKQTHRCKEESSGYQRRKEGRAKWVIGMNCMVPDRNEIFGGEHAVVYTEVEM